MSCGVRILLIYKKGSGEDSSVFIGHGKAPPGLTACGASGARRVCAGRIGKFGLKPTLARNRERGRIRVATAAEPWEGAEESDP